MIYLCGMKEIIIDKIQQHLSERKSPKVIMVIHPESFEKFIDQIMDPELCVTVINQIARNETINVRMYGLNITVYRSFDIPKNEIILHEQTN